MTHYTQWKSIQVKGPSVLVIEWYTKYNKIDGMQNGDFVTVAVAIMRDLLCSAVFLYIRMKRANVRWQIHGKTACQKPNHI